MNTRKRTAAIIINSLLILMEIIGLIIALNNHGLIMLGFYTQESNIMLLIASSIYLVALLNHKDGNLPRWATIVKYVATSLVMVTLIVVITVLLPMCRPYGTGAMINLLLGEANLYHHTLCPILAIISFLTIESDIRLTVKHNLIATAPTLFYAIVTTTLNVAKVVKGPYPFLYVYEQPVWQSILWFIGIVGAGYIFAFLLRLTSVKKEKF